MSSSTSDPTGMATMTAGRKFDFGNSFDAGERGMVAARDFTMADIEKARTEAFEAGRTAGIAAERGSIEHASASALAALDKGLSALAAELVSLRDRVEKESLTTVLQIVRKLMPHYVKAHGTQEIEGIVRDCLSTVYDEPRIVIRAHEPVLDHLKDRLDQLVTATGFGGKVVLFADETMPESHCRVEWADGGAERDISRLWSEVENSISRFLENEPKSATAASANTGDHGQ